MSQDYYSAYCSDINTMSETTATTEVKDRACCFCGLSEDNELEYGKIYEQDGLVTHYYCLLLSSNMEQRGSDNEGILGFLIRDIQKEICRGKRLVCSYCKKKGATLGCCNIKCKKIFHFPCGLRAGSLHQFFDEFRSYCISHRPKQKINEHIKKELGKVEETPCCICYEPVNAQDFINTLWAPCCKKNTWFHRKCIQQLALSAGYFFKCPLCNNKHEFEQAMKENGIFIPSQDASWELVPNAFEELLYRHDQCDAPICICPKGRKYTSKNVKWELVLCRLCGSQGIHTACGQLKWGIRNWECNECSAILRHTKVEDDDTSKSTSNVEDEDSDSEDSDTDISVGQYSPVQPSVNCANEYECSSPEYPPDISPVKIRPGPRSFKIKQEIYANTLMGRISNNDASSCDKKNTTPLMEETESKSLPLEKSISSSNLSNLPENEDMQKDMSDSEIIVIESDDDTQNVQQEVPKEESVENELSVGTENTEAPEEDEPNQESSCASTQENESNEPRSDTEAMENISDNTACVNAASSETITEDSSASSETNDNEDPLLSIKIVNVTSLPPEVFAGVSDSNEEESSTSLNPPIDQESSPLTVKESPVLSAAVIQTDSSLKRKPDDARVVSNVTNDSTAEKCKKLRSDDSEKASTSIPSSVSTPVYNLDKNGMLTLTNSLAPNKNYSTLRLRRILPKPHPAGNSSAPNATNLEIDQLLRRNRSDVSPQTVWQDQSSNSSKSYARHSFPLNTVHDAANDYVQLDPSSNPQIIIQLPSNIAGNTIAISQQEEQNAIVLNELNFISSSNPTFEQSNEPVIVQNEQYVNSDANQYTVTNDITAVTNVSNSPQSQLTSNPQTLQMRNFVEIRPKPTLDCTASTNDNQHITERCHGDAGTSPAVETRPADVLGPADPTNPTTACRSPEPPCSRSGLQRTEKQDLSNTIFTRSHRTSDCRKNAFGQRENVCDRARMTAEYVRLCDLKFRVCGSDNLQMILYDTFSVDIDVAQAPKREANVCSPKRVPSHVTEDLKHATHDPSNSEPLVNDGNESNRDDSKENRTPRGKMENVSRDASCLSGSSGKIQVTSKESKENHKQSELSSSTVDAKRRSARVHEKRNTKSQNEEIRAIKYSAKQSNVEENIKSFGCQGKSAISQDADSTKLNTKINRARNSRKFESRDIPTKNSNGIHSDNQDCESHVDPDGLKITTRSAMKMIRCMNFEDDSSSEKKSTETDNCCRVSIDLDRIRNLIDAKPGLLSAENFCYDVKLREYINSVKDNLDMKEVITLPCKRSKDLKKSQASDNFKDTLAKDKVVSYVTCTKDNLDVDKALIHENPSVTKDLNCDANGTANNQLEQMFISNR